MFMYDNLENCVRAFSLLSYFEDSQKRKHETICRKNNNTTAVATTYFSSSDGMLLYYDVAFTNKNFRPAQEQLLYVLFIVVVTQIHA